MNVSEVMTRHTSTCEPADSLERAAGVMWDRDCGVVPVVGEDGQLHGLVTDRDVAMAAYLKGRALSAIRVADVMTTDLHCCAASDTVERALTSMRQHQINRMPVVDGEGRLAGMLSMADLLQATQRASAKDRPTLSEGVLETMTAVHQPRAQAPLPSPAKVAAPATVPASAPAAKQTQAPITAKMSTVTSPPAPNKNEGNKKR